MSELAKLPCESRLKELRIYSLYCRQQCGHLIETYTVNGESFTGLNFCGLLEERESFPHESFALKVTYKCLGLAPRKYYHKNPYNVDAVKV